MFVFCYSLCNYCSCGSCSGVLVVGRVPAPVLRIDQAVICNGKSVGKLNITGYCS